MKNRIYRIFTVAIIIITVSLAVSNTAFSKSIYGDPPLKGDPPPPPPPPPTP